MSKIQYSVVWQKCSKNSKISSRFYVPEYEGYLPFFIWGDELSAFKEKKEIQLREEQLLKGILFGLYEFDNDPKPWHQEENRKTLLYLLDVLGNGFKYETPEKMVLDVAYSLREQVGNEVSCTVLDVGRNLVPDSSPIKSDLILDLWILSTVSENKGKEYFERIVQLIQQIQLDKILPEAKEIICYYGFCAAVLLKKEDLISAYLEKYVYPNVTGDDLKIKIKELLDDPEQYSAKDLMID